MKFLPLIVPLVLAFAVAVFSLPPRGGSRGLSKSVTNYCTEPCCLEATKLYLDNKSNEIDEARGAHIRYGCDHTAILTYQPSCDSHNYTGYWEFYWLGWPVASSEIIIDCSHVEKEDLACDDPPECHKYPTGCTHLINVPVTTPGCVDCDSIEGEFYFDMTDSQGNLVASLGIPCKVSNNATCPS